MILDVLSSLEVTKYLLVLLTLFCVFQLADVMLTYIVMMSCVAHY